MEKSKEQRISTEIRRLSKILKEIPEDKKKLVAGLIERAAFMRIECEDLEKFLKENGWAEGFQQSDKVPPYDRARPQGQTYTTLNANYQKIMKQLTDLLPAKPAETDDLMDFIK